MTKQIEYRDLLRAEYKNMKACAATSRKVQSHLDDLEKLLNRVQTLKSPQKEWAFVEGVMRLRALPKLAA